VRPWPSGGRFRPTRRASSPIHPQKWPPLHPSGPPLHASTLYLERKGSHHTTQHVGRWVMSTDDERDDEGSLRDSMGMLICRRRSTATQGRTTDSEACLARCPSTRGGPTKAVGNRVNACSAVRDESYSRIWRPLQTWEMMGTKVASRGYVRS
jgi:hypothetical protein